LLTCSQVVILFCGLTEELSFQILLGIGCVLLFVPSSSFIPQMQYRKVSCLEITSEAHLIDDSNAYAFSLVLLSTTLYSFWNTQEFFNGFWLCFVYLVFFEARSHYVAQAGSELPILLPQPSECWDYRCAPPCPA
jgi:hypothetical protein